MGKVESMRKMKGLSIIQLMLILLLAGIVAKLAIELLIRKRCEDRPAIPLCAERQGAGKP